MDFDMIKFCTGEDSHIIVTCIEDRAVREDDIYHLRCTKCGKEQNDIAKRPRQTSMMCGEDK